MKKKILNVLSEIKDEEYADAEQKYDDANKIVDKAMGDANQTLDDIIDKAVEGFETLSEDIKDIAEDLKKAIEKTDWGKAKKVVEVLEGTAKGVDEYTNQIKELKQK